MGLEWHVDSIKQQTFTLDHLRQIIPSPDAALEYYQEFGDKNPIHYSAKSIFPGAIIVASLHVPGTNATYRFLNPIIKEGNALVGDSAETLAVTYYSGRTLQPQVPTALFTFMGRLWREYEEGFDPNFVPMIDALHLGGTMPESYWAQVDPDNRKQDRGRMYERSFSLGAATFNVVPKKIFERMMTEHGLR